MDELLKGRLVKIHNQIERLFEIEKRYGELKAHEKVLFAELYLSTQGANVKERECHVYASKDWRDFIKGLTLMQAEKNQAERLLELLNQAYQVCYLEFKLTNETLKKN
jgi:hypothetical protein